MENSTSLSKYEARERIHLLLDDLDDWSLLYLRQALRTKLLRFSSLHHLPSEVINLILQQLNLKDFLNLASTCCEWRAAILDPDVINSLTRINFPGVLETLAGQGNTPQSVLFDACRDLFDRYYSYRDSNNLHTVQRWFMSSSDFEGSSQTAADGLRRESDVQVEFASSRLNTIYCNGKFAWQPDSSFFYLQNLEAYHDHRKITFGGSLISGRKYDLLTMGDQLIVMTVLDSTRSTSCRQLRILKIDDGEWKDISIPSPLAKCYVLGLRLYVTTTTAELFSWSWGGKLITYAIPRTGMASEPEGGTLSLSTPGIIPHPVELGTVYAVWLYEYDVPKPDHLEESGHDGCKSDSYYSYDSSGSDDSFIQSGNLAYGNHGSSASSVASIPSSRGSDEDEYNGKLFIVVVIKYVDGKPSRRLTSRIVKPGHPPRLSRWKTSQRCSLKFYMLCQKLNMFGSHLIGVVRNTNYPSSRRYPETWSGVAFNIQTETFLYMNYSIDSAGQNDPNNYPINYEENVAQDVLISAYDHLLIITEILSDGIYQEPIIMYATNWVPGILSDINRLSFRVSSNSEPHSSIARLRCLDYGLLANPVLMDDAGVLMSTDKAFIFSANRSNIAGTPQQMETHTYKLPIDLVNKKPVSHGKHRERKYRVSEESNPFPDPEIILDCFNATETTVSKMYRPENLIHSHRAIYDEARWKRSSWADWDLAPDEGGMRSVTAPRPPGLPQADATIDVNTDPRYNTLWPLWQS